MPPDAAAASHGRDAAATHDPDADAPAVPRWALVAALALAAALQAWSWSRVDGYEIADVVEYLERARAFVVGEPLGEGSVRSFGFSAVLVPLFWLTHALELSDAVAVDLARLMQMLIALGAVVVVARTAARLGGSSAGVGAAFLMAANPVFSQYAVAPLSGTAALACIALGTALGARRPAVARAVGAGAAFGAAISFAYQCLPVVVPLAIGIGVRTPWRRARYAAALAVGLSLPIAVNGSFDRLIYGRFATSLETYTAQNVYPILASAALSAGLQGPAKYFYDQVAQAGDPTDGAEVRSLRPRTWYVTEVDEWFLVWPALGLVVLGSAWALGRRRWLPLVLLATVVFNVALLSTKGSKSFRLLLPLLPAIAVIGGLGFAWLWRPGGVLPLLPVRRLGAVVALVGTVWLAPKVLERVNFAKHGAYWRALDVLVESYRERPGPDPSRPARFASAYHWAVCFRESPGLQLDRLDYPLHAWRALPPAAQQHVIEHIARLDAFIGHMQVFTQDPRLFELVNEQFEILRVIDDGYAMEELDPVYVLRRHHGRPGGHRFFDVVDAASIGDGLDDYRARIEHPTHIEFRREQADGSDFCMTFLGFDVDYDLCEGGQAWITMHWLAGPGTTTEDYLVFTRWIDANGRAYHRSKQPAHDMWPTSRWQPGQIVREHFLSGWNRHWPAFGQAFLRGDTLSIELYLAVVDQVKYEFHRAGGFPPHGRRWTSDGLVHGGGFWWPIPEAERLPDDGRRLPGEK